MIKKIKLLLFTVLFSANLFANVTLTIGEYAPYTSKTNLKGKISEVIVREAFKLENINVIYKYYPWIRAYNLAKAGTSDGTFPWQKIDDRTKDFIYTQEILIQISDVFFHLKSLDFQWENIEDLKKYKIGGTVAYSHITTLKDAGITVHVVSKEELNFKKLLIKRIDAYPTSIFVGYDYINKLFDPEKAALFTNHPKQLTNGNHFLLISKKTKNAQNLADKFDRGLRKLKKSGRYDEIIADFLFR